MSKTQIPNRPPLPPPTPPPMPTTQGHIYISNSLYNRQFKNCQFSISHPLAHALAHTHALASFFDWANGPLLVFQRLPPRSKGFTTRRHDSHTHSHSHIRILSIGQMALTGSPKEPPSIEWESQHGDTTLHARTTGGFVALIFGEVNKCIMIFALWGSVLLM